MTLNTGLCSNYPQFQMVIRTVSNLILGPTRSASLHSTDQICKIDYIKCLVRHLLRRFVRVAGLSAQRAVRRFPKATYGSRRQAGG
jgi:hypothetical protein